MRTMRPKAAEVVSAGARVKPRAAPDRLRQWGDFSTSSKTVTRVVDLYNEHWLPEKNGFLSPSATRAAWYAQHGMEVAA